MKSMRSPDRHKMRWILGVLCFALGGGAWAEGNADGAPVLVASIAPSAMEVVMPMPEPGPYVLHYALQYSSYQEATAGLKPTDFYAAPYVASESYQGNAAPVQATQTRPQFQIQPQQQADHRLDSMAPSASLLDMFRLVDDEMGNVVHPQRRLALILDDWHISANAHVPLTHPHDTGATVSLKHSF
jgi:hypothetical protein